MPTIPFPLTATDMQGLVNQVQLLVFELYEERIGGALIGDVFTIGSDDVLTLTLASAGGLEKSSSALQVKVDTSGGLQVDSDGISVFLKADTGLAVDSDGLYVKVRANYGLNLDANGLALKQQAAEANANAVSAIQCGTGTDTFDLAAFNADLTTLTTEINAIKTVLNNLLTKLRSAEIIAT